MCSGGCTKRQRSRRIEEIEAWLEAMADSSGANAYNFSSHITKVDMEPHGHSCAELTFEQAFIVERCCSTKAQKKKKTWPNSKPETYDILTRVHCHQGPIKYSNKADL
jgi:hypothetical protein